MKIELCPFDIDQKKKITLKDYLSKELNISGQQIKSFLNPKQRQQLISSSETLELDNNLLNQFHVNPIYQGPKISYQEDDNFLYLEKPNNIFTQPLHYNESNNILSFIRSINRGHLFRNHNRSWEKGLLNRLDFVTSGILIYVKNFKNHKFIRDNFSSIVKNKYYLCIVENEFEKDFLNVKTYMNSSGEKSSKMNVSKEGIYAEMDVLKLGTQKFSSQTKTLSFLAIKLKTGIRHQIRCLLSNLDYPIVGDVLYGAKQSKRVYLHAYNYEFNVTGDKFGAKSQKLLLEDKLFKSFLDLNGGFDMIDNKLLTF